MSSVIENAILAHQGINYDNFHQNFIRTNVSKHAIFTDRKALMDELYESGVPILVDQSYYHHCSYLLPLEKVGETYVCGGQKKFEEWRDCHYYSLYQSTSGMKVWLMTGGRYD